MAGEVEFPVVHCSRGNWCIFAIYEARIPNGTNYYIGAEHAMIEYIAKAMRFKTRYFESPDGFWGSLIDNRTNTFNGMVGTVQKKVSFFTCTMLCPMPHFNATTRKQNLPLV